MKTIYIAGGCFWGIQEYYRRLKGVTRTTVGYANGNIENPTYEDLKSHRATHAETVKIDYDEKTITLEKLLEHFLRIVNPFNVDHQGEDYGHQYRSGVYYTTNEDRNTIRRYFGMAQTRCNRAFATEVEELKEFYSAERYHQDYLQINPNGYCHVDFSLIAEHEKK